MNCLKCDTEHTDKELCPARARGIQQQPTLSREDVMELSKPTRINTHPDGDNAHVVITLGK